MLQIKVSTILFLLKAGEADDAERVGLWVEVASYVIYLLLLLATVRQVFSGSCLFKCCQSNIP